MKCTLLPSIIVLLTILTGCQTSGVSNDFQDFLEGVGLVDEPFNPDDITITLIELKELMPIYVANLQVLQKGQNTIRDLQLKLELLDHQIRISNGLTEYQALMLNYDQTVKKRNILQQKARNALNMVSANIAKSQVKKFKATKKVNVALEDQNGDHALNTKLVQQLNSLQGIGQQLSGINASIQSTQRGLEAIEQYTVLYDNNRRNMQILASQSKSKIAFGH